MKHPVQNAILLLLVLGLTGPAPGQDAPAGGVDDFREPVLEAPLFLLVPQELWHLSEAWNDGKFLLRIGRDGRVQDWIPLFLPHYRLHRPFDRAFEEAQFSPATENGEPVVVDVKVQVPLAGIGGYGVISLDVGTYIEARISTMSPDVNALRLVPPGQLDSPLEIVDKGQGVIPVDPDGNVLSGTVEVEFYVDPAGIPRMIRPVGDFDPRLAEAAIMNVETFQLTLPRLRGRPAVARARIPVVLGKSR